VRRSPILDILVHLHAQEQVFVYNDNNLNPEYRGRNVTVEINDTVGDYALVIASVRLRDAGTYTCQAGGVGEAAAAWIAVLGQYRHTLTPPRAHLICNAGLELERILAEQLL